MMKKGVSPVIATVLLIVIVLVLAATVFIWAQGFIREGIQKGGEPVERVCSSTAFSATVVQVGSDYVLDINNQANVPLYGFEIKLLGEGQSRAQEVVASGSIDIGQSASIILAPADFDEIYNPSPGTTEVNLLVVPILLGERGEATEPFTCPDQTGIGVTVIV